MNSRQSSLNEVTCHMKPPRVYKFWPNNFCFTVYLYCKSESWFHQPTESLPVTGWSVWYFHIAVVRSESISLGGNPYLSIGDVHGLLCTPFHKCIGAHDIARQWLHSGNSSLQLYFLNSEESQITFKVVFICVRPLVLGWTHLWHKDKLNSLASENYFWVFPMSNQIWELRLPDKIRYMKLLEKLFHYHILNCQRNKKNGIDWIKAH